VHALQLRKLCLPHLRPCTQDPLRLIQWACTRGLSAAHSLETILPNVARWDNYGKRLDTVHTRCRVVEDCRFLFSRLPRCLRSLHPISTGTRVQFLTSTECPLLRADQIQHEGYGTLWNTFRIIAKKMRLSDEPLRCMRTLRL
jgi:hypothetical protein